MKIIIFFRWASQCLHLALGMPEKHIRQIESSLGSGKDVVQQKITQTDSRGKPRLEMIAETFKGML